MFGWLISTLGRFSYGRGFADGFDEGYRAASEEILDRLTGVGAVMMQGVRAVPAADSSEAKRRHVIALDACWSAGAMPERVCGELPCVLCGPLRSGDTTKED